MFTKVQSGDEGGGAEEKKSNFVWKQFQSLISKEGVGRGAEQVVYYSARVLQKGGSAYC